MDESRVVIRPSYTETDEPFIYSAWRNSAYYLSSVPHGTIEAKDFFKKKTKEIREILWKASVRVACLESDQLMLIGFSVFTGDHLNWVYVKLDYRRSGVGRLLVPAGIQTVTDQPTKIGADIIKKKSLKMKGDLDGTSQDRRREDFKENEETRGAESPSKDGQPPQTKNQGE